MTVRVIDSKFYVVAEIDPLEALYRVEHCPCTKACLSDSPWMVKRLADQVLDLDEEPRYEFVTDFPTHAEAIAWAMKEVE